MKTNIDTLLSIARRSALFLLMLIAPASAVYADMPRLAPAQNAVVARQIAKLKYPQERALATGWTDAKKVAEFICRPLAMKVLQRRNTTADRVFLGTDDPKTLNLVSNRRLDGSGQVRTANGWEEFSFTCQLSPKTGTALSFKTMPSPASSAPIPAWRRHFGPGPVRSPTFNPSNWPGQNRQPQ